MKITAVVLTFNEELHIGRCISSLMRVTDRILIVDSYSTDKTVELATASGARVIQHAFINHAQQFNWALEHLNEDDEWVFRVDADEYLDDALVDAIQMHLAQDATVDGYYVQRRLIFQGRDIRHGMVYPVNILRLFRRGKGTCIERWMDEHIQVTGATSVLSGTLFDHNLQPLTWWTAKHNRYASLEAIEQLDQKYHFLRNENAPQPEERLTVSLKRWAKHHLYGALPPGARAFVYFLFRYIIALGFLDGREGTTFHVLQGFWYRYLVDAKAAEVERYIRDTNCDIQTAIQNVLQITVSTAPRD